MRQIILSNEDARRIGVNQWEVKFQNHITSNDRVRVACSQVILENTFENITQDQSLEILIGSNTYNIVLPAGEYSTICTLESKINELLTDQGAGIDTEAIEFTVENNKITIRAVGDRVKFSALNDEGDEFYRLLGVYDDTTEVPSPPDYYRELDIAVGTYVTGSNYYRFDRSKILSLRYNLHHDGVSINDVAELTALIFKVDKTELGDFIEYEPQQLSFVHGHSKRATIQFELVSIDSAFKINQYDGRFWFKLEIDD